VETTGGGIATYEGSEGAVPKPGPVSSFGPLPAAICRANGPLRV